MRRSLLLVSLALLAAGCGGDDGETPAACIDGQRAYLAALERAPAEVLLGGEVPISECLAENQKPGDVAAVGVAMIGAATTLNAEAREAPGGAANLRLGYLIGAAQRGAERTEGIHADLIRRLAVAARYSPGKEDLSAEFLEIYREGFDAGHAHG